MQESGCQAGPGWAGKAGGAGPGAESPGWARGLCRSLGPSVLGGSGSPVTRALAKPEAGTTALAQCTHQPCRPRAHRVLCAGHSAGWGTCVMSLPLRGRLSLEVLVIAATSQQVRRLQKSGQQRCVFVLLPHSS